MRRLAALAGAARPANEKAGRVAPHFYLTTAENRSSLGNNPTDWGEYPRVFSGDLVYQVGSPWVDVFDCSMKSPCRVVIIDDHHTLRDLLKVEIPRQSSDHFQIVGEAGTGQEAIDVCQKTHPDLVVFDLMLPGEVSGLEALQRLRQRQPKLRVLVFSGCVQRALIAQTIVLGVAGFVRKAQPLRSLFDAMQEVEAGGQYFEPQVARLVESNPLLTDWQTLTSREREVVRHIAEGRSTKEAAAIMGLSVKTVDKHRSRMMKKLRLHDAVAVTRYAIQAGLVSLN
jgi:DNA-binding NarL/FixJ family response regulator